MGKRRPQEVSPGILSWADVKAMGALSIILDYFASPEQRKKQKQEERRQQRQSGGLPQPKPQPRSRFLEMQPNGRGEGNKPKEQKMSFDDMQKVIQKQMEDNKGQIKPTPDSGSNPGNSPYPLFDYGASGNRPGVLVNPDKPDQLPMRPRRKARNMHRRKETEGNLPKYFHRWPIDQKVFAGSMVKGGRINSRGTVLVDMSGSMAWTEEMINVLLDNLPEGTVYAYCGGGSLSGGGFNGRWACIADRGRAVPAELVARWAMSTGANNLVDLPCLEILAHLPGPRYWISDTQVTGTHSLTKDLWDKAMQVCKDYKITPIRNGSQMAGFMRYGRPLEYPVWAPYGSPRWQLP